jgi:hypothetical protein
MARGYNRNLRCARSAGQTNPNPSLSGSPAIPKAVTDAEFDTHQSDDELG